MSSNSAGLDVDFAVLSTSGELLMHCDTKIHFRDLYNMTLEDRMHYVSAETIVYGSWKQI